MLTKRSYKNRKSLKFFNFFPYLIPNLMAKLLVLVRHGERADFKGKTPFFGQHDTELTERGKLQAIECGKMISKFIKEKSINIDLNNISLKVSSSPFIRTLQTARGILNGMRGCFEDSKANIPNEIIVDNRLCEIINFTFNGQIPVNFLNIIDNNEKFKTEFNDIKLQVKNSFDLLPKEEEEVEIFEKRMKKYTEEIVKEISEDQNNNVFILVSHAGSTNQMNINLGHPGPFGWFTIDYCHTFFYSSEGEGFAFKYIKSETPKIV